jgi:hypothetical protein
MSEPSFAMDAHRSGKGNRLRILAQSKGLCQNRLRSEALGPGLAKGLGSSGQRGFGVKTRLGQNGFGKGTA